MGLKDKPDISRIKAEILRFKTENKFLKESLAINALKAKKKNKFFLGPRVYYFIIYFRMSRAVKSPFSCLSREDENKYTLNFMDK